MAAVAAYLDHMQHIYMSLIITSCSNAGHSLLHMPSTLHASTAQQLHRLSSSSSSSAALVFPQLLLLRL